MEKREKTMGSSFLFSSSRMVKQNTLRDVEEPIGRDATTPHCQSLLVQKKVYM